MDVRAQLERPAVRWALVAVAAVAVLHAVAAVALLGLQRTHAGTVLPGVEVDGVDVGGLDPELATDLVARRADARLAETVRLTTASADREDDATGTTAETGEVLAIGELETDRAALGVSADVEATVEDAWARGRRGLWQALREQLRVRLGGTLGVPLHLEVDHRHLAAWTRQAADELSTDARDGAIAFVAGGDPDAADVEVTDARIGLEVAADDLAERVHEGVLRRLGPLHVEVPAQSVEPAVTDADVEAALPDAEVAVSAPIVLTNPSPDGEDLELSPAELADVLEVRRDPDAPEGERLWVTTDAERLVDHLGDDGLAALETAVAEVEVSAVDGELVVDGGTPGFTLDADAAAEVVVEAASRHDDRTAELPGEVTEPDTRPEDLAEAGITEIVSSFTTELVPDEPRNANIQLAADMIDGDVIEPGETYSLNEGIGRRTAARGFVENGFIEDGELISVTGGGVSQMGTTFVNAAWFAGIAILEFHPHSLHFARYPEGREATLAWGSLDVVVENDSPYAIMILTEHSGSSVTVHFASTGWAQVDTWTGERTDIVPGETRDGFTVEFGRDITYPDGSTTSESYTHTYEPEE